MNAPSKFPVPQVLVVCDQCKRKRPHMCGFEDRNEVRLTRERNWVCRECYEETRTEADLKDFDELLPAPEVFAPRPDVAKVIVDTILELQSELDALKDKVAN